MMLSVTCSGPDWQFKKIRMGHIWQALQAQVSGMRLNQSKFSSYENAAVCPWRVWRVHQLKTLWLQASYAVAMCCCASANDSCICQHSIHTDFYLLWSCFFDTDVSIGSLLSESFPPDFLFDDTCANKHIEELVRNHFEGVQNSEEMFRFFTILLVTFVYCDLMSVHCARWLVCFVFWVCVSKSQSWLKDHADDILYVVPSVKKQIMKE